MADGTEIATGHEHGRCFQSRNPVEDRMLVRQGGHHPAHPLDEGLSRRDRFPTIVHELGERYRTVFARRGHVGRQRGSKSPGTYSVELGGIVGRPERVPQKASITGCRVVCVEARDDWLERENTCPARANLSNRKTGQQCFAHPCPGAGDEYRAHVFASTASIAAASPVTSPKSCDAENAQRNRAVPAGTVGGRIATTR